MTKKEQATLAAAIRKISDITGGQDPVLRAIVQQVRIDLDLNGLAFSQECTGIMDLSGRDHVSRLREQVSA